MLFFCCCTGSNHPSHDQLTLKLLGSKRVQMQQQQQVLVLLDLTREWPMTLTQLLQTHTHLQLQVVLLPLLLLLLSMGLRTVMKLKWVAALHLTTMNGSSMTATLWLMK